MHTAHIEQLARETAMDTIYREHADEQDVAVIDTAHAYNYRLQRWERADHAHFEGDNLLTSPPERLLFCGADRQTCERSIPRPLA